MASASAKASNPDRETDATGLTIDQKKIVQSVWNGVKKNMKTHGLNIFVGYLKLYPDYVSLFNFDDDSNTDLMQNISVQAHVINVMSGVGVLIEHGLPEPEIFRSIMHKLGKNHLRRNVQTKHIQKFCDQLQKYLVTNLKFTPQYEAAWREFFKSIVHHFEETLGQ